MLIRHVTICAATLVGAVALAATSAHALTTQECSAKYKAAKAAGTLNGMKWNDFRKAQCGGEAAAEPAPAAAPPPAAPPPAAGKPAAAAPPPAKPAATTTPPPAPVASGNIVFPPAVSPKYSTDSAGKARMLTCRDQYETNKATNANGGLKWIQKGGGYYSECNKHLKGQA
jgi:hypothetical protein